MKFKQALICIKEFQEIEFSFVKNFAKNPATTKK